VTIKNPPAHLGPGGFFYCPHRSRFPAPLTHKKARLPMIGSGLYPESGAVEGNRTPNLLIRSQMLYPIELQLRAGREDKARLGIAAQALFQKKRPDEAPSRLFSGSGLLIRLTLYPYSDSCVLCYQCVALSVSPSHS
jgi:hypothetical protein